MYLVVPILLATQCLCTESVQLGSIDFFKRASEQLALGHDLQALGDFRKSLAVDPTFKPAQYNLASTYLRLGLIDQALNASQPLYCADARCNDVGKKAKEFHDLMNEQDIEEDNDCILYSKMLEISPKSVETLKSRAQCYFARGRPIDAIRDLTLVVQIDKADSDSSARAAVGSYVLLGQRQQALQILRRCVSYDADAAACKTATKDIRKLQKLVESQPPQKLKINTVIKETRTLLKKYDIPRNSEDGVLVNNLRLKRCQVLAEREKYSMAAAVCAQARDFDPDFPAALLVQSRVEYEQGNHAQALELASKIMKRAEESKDSGISQRILQLAHQVHDDIMYEQHQSRQQQHQQQQPSKDLYKVLGVSKDADTREIRRAYRQLSKTYHPDKYKGKDMDENQIMEKMQEINEAYEILSNNDKRKNYDDERSGGGFQGGGFQGGGFQGGGFQGGGFQGGGFQGGGFQGGGFQGGGSQGGGINLEKIFQNIRFNM